MRCQSVFAASSVAVYANNRSFRKVGLQVVFQALCTDPDTAYVAAITIGTVLWYTGLLVAVMAM